MISKEDIQAIKQYIYGNDIGYISGLGFTEKSGDRKTIISLIEALEESEALRLELERKLEILTEKLGTAHFVLDEINSNAEGHQDDSISSKWLVEITGKAIKELEAKVKE